MNARFLNLVLLAVCLGLLGTLIVTLYVLKKKPDLVAATEPMVVTNIITQTQIAVRKVNASNLLAALSKRPVHWSTIESTNYQVYIANLRAAGCPEETIKDIILTDIAKLYGRRRAALRANEPYKFWVADDTWNNPYRAAPEVQEQLSALDREQSALVRELLEVDFQTEMSKYFSDGIDYQERAYSFLPEEKRDQVMGLQQKYDDLEQAIYARTKGILLPQDEADLLQLRRAREEELGKVLTPQEVEEYQLRNSDTANSLRTQLSGLQPSEQEFRKLFRLQKSYKDAFAQLDPTDPATPETKLRAQQEALSALNEEVKKAIGEQRFNEYTRLQDDDYRHLLQLTDRLELPKEVAGRVYDMRRDAEVQKQRIESDPNLTFEQRQRTLAAIARETEKALSGVMTAQALAAYKSSGATWLNDLRQTEVPEPAPELPPLPPGFPVPIPQRPGAIP